MNTFLADATARTSLNSDLIAARYQLHRGIVQRTESYLWLLDTNYYISSAVQHPLDHPDSMSVHYTTNGSLVVSNSTLRRLTCLESALYTGSSKSWLVPIAQFPTMNPEKCRRFVRNLFSFIHLTNSIFL